MNPALCRNCRYYFLTDISQRSENLFFFVFTYQTWLTLVRSWIWYCAASFSCVHCTPSSVLRPVCPSQLGCLGVPLSSAHHGWRHTSRHHTGRRIVSISFFRRGCQCISLHSWPCSWSLCWIFPWCRFYPQVCKRLRPGYKNDQILCLHRRCSIICTAGAL